MQPITQGTITSEDMVGRKIASLAGNRNSVVRSTATRMKDEHTT